jgi:CHAT domain-containing protein
MPAGTGLKPLPHSGTQFPAKYDGQTAFSSPMREASGLFRSGHYLESLQKYQSLHEIAQRQGNLDYVARTTGNIGGCQFALHQYQPALRAFQEARQKALAAGDTGLAAAFEGNIASLYTELGNLDAAAQWTKDSLARISGRDRAEQLAKLQILMGILLARQKKSDEARQYFRQGIEAADRAGDLETWAVGWNGMGQEYLQAADPDPGKPSGDPALRQRRLESAEAALLEAYRVRKLHRLPLDTSYRNLGSLRLAQGDLEAAAALFDRAVELSQRPEGILPTWDVYYRRGVVRLRQGRLPEALRDLRVAVKLGRAWRWSAPLDQTARIGTEGWLNKVYSALIAAGNRLHLETGDGALVRETFEAAEESRADSLRALVGQANRDDLPANFWEALSALQRAEVQALRSGSGAQEALEAAHARLVFLEASLGPAYQPLPGGLLERTRRALGPDTAWFSFHLGDSDSWLWAVDRGGLVLYRLPPRERIVAEIRAATSAIREDSPSADAAGEALYLTLFGDLAPRFRSKSRWLLALDPELFDAPLAALRESAGGRMRYLVEDHITEIVPGSGYWLDSAERRRKPVGASLFLGIGDPIYNTADARLAAAPQLPNASIFHFELHGPNGGSQAPLLMLPRLVASGSELDACARVWKGDHMLLKGPAASRQQLALQLLREPAVVHFATHFLEVPGKQADNAIALGLTAENEIDLLTPEEIAHWTVRAGLVVLSGCHSAAGAVLPGTGLLGLTHAFLAAGAGAVVSSRWSTPDDDGALFAALYANLGAQAPADPGRGLRAAQLSMIRSGGRRARPSYWSAYFVVGNL